MIKTSASRVNAAVNELKYILTTPTDYNPGKESLPLIVFLHGAGERGDNIESVKAHGIPKLFCADENYHGLRVVTLSPQCPDNYVWNNLTSQLMALIEIVVHELNIDRSRITLTGLSMGGYGTWEMACSYPGYFAAVAPVCGGGMFWRSYTLVGTPIRVYHGAADPVVHVEQSREMVDALRNDHHWPVEYFEYEGVGHDSWVQAYEQSDLIEWLAGGYLENKENK